MSHSQSAKHIKLIAPKVSGMSWQEWAGRIVQFLQLKLDQLDRENDLILSDKGSPEGVVSAPIGSLYLRLDGGAGSTLYVKEGGGHGRTGWQAK